MKVMVVSIVIDAFGTVSKGLERWLGELKIGANAGVKNLQGECRVDSRRKKLS